MSQLHRISGCDGASRQADVVFIHGLGGDAFGTWRHGHDEFSSWPHWLGAEFPDVGVWSLGHAASPSRLAKLLHLIDVGDVWLAPGDLAGALAAYQASLARDSTWRKPMKAMPAGSATSA